MSCHTQVDEWTTIIHTQLPALRTPQATILALWSLGMVLARSCALTAVNTLLATLLKRQEQTVRQQWREWGSEAAAKRGAWRQTRVGEDGCMPLRRWGLKCWQGAQWAVALAATTLGTRFTVLARRVVDRGWALPVAWTILPAHITHAWRRHWLRMLRQLRPAILPAGPASCGPIAACRPAGYLDGACAWAGIRVCASRPAERVGPIPRRPLGPWPASGPSRAAVGAAPAPPANARRAGGDARGGRAGKRATKPSG